MTRPPQSEEAKHAREWMRDNTDKLKQAAGFLRAQQPEQSRTTRFREPPTETGQRLGTLKRGEDQELRINWEEYKGRNFVSLKIWQRDSDGQWWPNYKKQPTVRMHELADFSDAIVAAMQAAALAQPYEAPEPNEPPF